MPILIAIGALVVLAALVATAAVILLDRMAQAFLWLAPVGPVAAWLLVGILLGGLVGLAAGFRRAGRPLGLFGAVPPLLAAWLLVSAGRKLPTPAEAPPTPPSAQVRVTSNELNLRAEPDPESAWVGRLSRGTVVEVEEIAGGWYRVAPSGTHPGGWIKGTYTALVQGTLPYPATVVDTMVTDEVVPEPPVRPAEKETRAEEPTAETTAAMPGAPSLRGAWRGRYDGYVAQLRIDHQDGSRFSGTLECEASTAPVSVGRYRIRVEGSIAPDRSVKLLESAVLSEPEGYVWTLGSSTGTLSASGSTLSGHGSADGPAYTWFFERY